MKTKIIFLLIIFFFVILKLKKPTKSKIIESYFDHLPYKFHWNIYKCKNQDCVKKNTFKCREECEKKYGKSTNLYEGIVERCKKNCLDYSDIQFDHLKYNNYIFNDALLFFNPNQTLL